MKPLLWLFLLTLGLSCCGQPNKLLPTSAGEPKALLTFKEILNYPAIPDTAMFIKALRSSCQLEVDDAGRDENFKERITYYNQVKINGSSKEFILLEYDSGDGCMAAYPWKYQLLFSMNGNLLEKLGSQRFELLEIFPNQAPFLLSVFATASGNGSHLIYKITADTLENIYDSNPGYEWNFQTFDACADNKVFEPNELTVSVRDNNQDGYNDLVFNGKIVLIQGQTKQGHWYDGEIINGKQIIYSVENPFKKIPIELVFLYNSKTMRFEAKEDYEQKYKQYD